MAARQSRCRRTVARKADIDRLFSETKKAYGKLDILVNNAGIYEFAPLENITEDSFHKQFNLQCAGPVALDPKGSRVF
jgi:3-oxoacyl-[acyl-carrier protein] reductase